MGRGPALGRVADPSAYLDGLKGQLGITAAQATSWDAFAEVVKAQAAQMLNLHVLWGRDANRHMGHGSKLSGRTGSGSEARARSNGWAANQGGRYPAWAQHPWADGTE